jgi:transcriptional regulator with XRE-family HTH domain
MPVVESPMTLGPRIRLIRLQQSRTLDEIARACGFTKSLLSKIENGHTVPPVATLTKIASALGVRVAALLDETPEDGSVHQAASGITAERFVRTDKGYSFFAFAGGRRNKAMQPYLFVAERGKVQGDALQHRGEEFVYMLEGTMRYRVGAAEFTLKPGDSVYFDGEEEHDLVPVTAKVRYLAVFVDRPSKKGGHR